MIGMDDTGPECDRRNVPFSGGAQTENESQGTSWQAGLIWVRHDRGIEQGSGFQRVFGQEIGTDQQPPLFGQSLIRQQQLANLFEAFQKQFADLPVSLG